MLFFCQPVLVTGSEGVLEPWPVSPAAGGANCVFVLFLPGHISPWKTAKQLGEQWDPHGSPQTSLSAQALAPGTAFPSLPQHRSSVPDSTEGYDLGKPDPYDLSKPDPYDLYEKSRAIYESRRPEYQEVEVHLLREKTGFGFRILGGDEAVQAVSPDARDKARMGRAGAHTHILCVALCFFANGSFLYNVGDAEHLSKATVCRAVRKVCLALKQLLPMFVVFPGHKPVRAIKEIVIGAIIENTPAERDGRLRPGDELISVDKMVVAGKPHRYVIDLMHAAARNGQNSAVTKDPMALVARVGVLTVSWPNSQCDSHQGTAFDNDPVDDGAALLRRELNIRRERVIRPRRYRFTSQSIIYIHNLIRPYICNITNRSHALTSQQILCVALRFFANGSFLYNVGDAEHLSKATVYSQIAT
ncbi:Membrane-associated guanylate kinase, WW and PDZ domain-containing protein 2 [Merluccius polli]|uniref:Membrane-associated guanylate kinase, WW and PDZ domain-containing protein 2 n=1 Tax=Merluccius polli TaxID=89951 RepID=A0AA47MBT3_MERPO|nr:Membrane-associated guanylate kinase, WW and PDZ domain-containing protein 2 [Merluccius polli]